MSIASRPASNVRRAARCLLAALALCSGAALQAAPQLQSARAEIEALMDVLRASNCRFNRNGTWYDGAAASAHLLDKLSYLERRGKVDSTETFIDLAASNSSASGKAYAVQCGETPAVPSRDWLMTHLRALRSAPRQPSAAAR
ncbi:MAG: DUF5329 domain-containing protein [Rhodocyclaceae bacterium]|nr:DUF5329 domain-containing protein [Rhodocyclaceae bacterium]